jgi:alpha-beta hydrolase superfamily lysophospholipase
MWHAAWCWQHWQELFAIWGWKLMPATPGHGGSPVQRRPLGALNYYFEFLKRDRAPAAPTRVAGTQHGHCIDAWYLKYGSGLPAAVLVAPWTSHNMLPSIFRSVWRDPLGAILCVSTLTSTPMARNPARAAEMFIHSDALYSPEELHARLGPESMWVLWQYNPLLWSPAKRTSIPLLWLAGAADTVISEPESRRSAAHYQAEYVAVPGAGHNLMMEKGYRETAEMIHKWLNQQNIK